MGFKRCPRCKSRAIFQNKHAKGQKTGYTCAQCGETFTAPFLSQPQNSSKNNVKIFTVRYGKLKSQIKTLNDIYNRGVL